MEKLRSDWQHGITAAMMYKFTSCLEPWRLNQVGMYKLHMTVLILATCCWNLCHLSSSIKSANLGVKSRTKFQIHSFHKWLSHSSRLCLRSLLSEAISTVVADALCSVGHRYATLHVYLLTGMEEVFIHLKDMGLGSKQVFHTVKYSALCIYAFIKYSLL